MTAWVKLYTDILGDPKLMRAAREGAKHLAFLPWLLAFAKRADDNGRLSVNGSAAELDDLVRDIPGATRKKIARSLAELEEIRVLNRESDGVLRFISWEKRAENRPSDSKDAIRLRAKAKRERDSEARKSLQDNNPVTNVTTDVTRDRNATEKSKRKRKRKSKRENKIPSAPDGAAGEPTSSSTPSGTPIDTPSAAAWTTEAGADWIAARKGTAPFGRIGAALLPLVERDGWPAIRPAWQRFVASPRARFGPEHFAANLQDFLATSPASLAAADSDWQVASDLWSLYDTAALTHERERSDWMQRGDELVAEGRYPSVEAFLAELRVTKPWTLGRCRTDEEAIAAIKKRIATQRSVVAAQVVASRQAGAA